MGASRSDTALWAVVVAVLLLLTSGQALGQRGVRHKRAKFYEGKDLRVSVGFREMFSRKMRQRLKSGFATTVVMRVYLYRRGGGRPVAFAVRTLKAYYDMWDERYLLVMQDHRGKRSVRLRGQKAVVDRLTSLWRFPIARTTRVRPGTRYFIAVIAEVNPLSDEVLAEVRRWLRNPYGGHRKVGSESFFGSFVSIFVNNKIRRAEKTFRVRTQPFYRRR